MVKKVLFLCIFLMIVHQAAIADDLALTLEVDKSSYLLGETASLTGTLKNVSGIAITIYSDIEYSFSVAHNGVEVWKWSLWRCG